LAFGQESQSRSEPQLTFASIYIRVTKEKQGTPHKKTIFLVALPNHFFPKIKQAPDKDFLCLILPYYDDNPILLIKIIRRKESQKPTKCQCILLILNGFAGTRTTIHKNRNGKISGF